MCTNIYVETLVSNKSEKWAEAFVLGWGLRLRWAEDDLRLIRAEVPECGAFLSDKILRQRLQAGSNKGERWAEAFV